jgi:rhamnosyl/mannosyltransferase
MRILHIGKYYWPFRGGLENVTRMLAEGAAERGNKVAVLVHGEARGDDRIDGVQIRRAWAPLRWLYTPLAPFMPYEIWRMSRRLEPEVIHIHLPNLSAFCLFLCPRTWRRPWILHWHADVVFGKSERLARFVYRCFYRPWEWLLLHRAAAVIVTSPNYLASSLALQSFRPKCRVIPLACPPAARPDGEPREWPAGSLRVLMVGRLTAYKGHSVLLEAIARLAELDTDVALVLVGGGEEEARIRQSLATPPLLGRVCLVGSADEAELAALYESCDLLCLPSLDRAEAFGLVLLEAMSHGKPVVASDLQGSGMGWVVEEGVNGWKFPAGDSAALADRLHWCALHPAAVREAGQVARGHVDARFSPERVVGEVIALYEHVVEREALACR